MERLHNYNKARSSILGAKYMPNNDINDILNIMDVEYGDSKIKGIIEKMNETLRSERNKKEEIHILSNILNDIEPISEYIKNRLREIEIDQNDIDKLQKIEGKLHISKNQKNKSDSDASKNDSTCNEKKLEKTENNIIKKDKIIKNNINKTVKFEFNLDKNIINNNKKLEMSNLYVPSSSQSKHTPASTSGSSHQKITKQNKNDNNSSKRRRSNTIVNNVTKKRKADHSDTEDENNYTEDDETKNKHLYEVYYIKFSSTGFEQYYNNGKPKYNALKELIYEWNENLAIHTMFLNKNGNDYILKIGVLTDDEINVIKKFDIVKINNITAKIVKHKQRYMGIIKNVSKKVDENAFRRLIEPNLNEGGIEDLKRKTDIKGDPKDEFLVEFKTEEKFIEAIMNAITLSNGKKVAVIPHKFMPKRCKKCHLLNDICKNMDRCDGNETCIRCGEEGGHYDEAGTLMKCETKQNELRCVLCNKNHASYSKNCKKLKKALQNCNRAYYRILNKAGARVKWLDELMDDDDGYIDTDPDSEAENNYKSIIKKQKELEDKVKELERRNINQQEVNTKTKEEMDKIKVTISTHETRINSAENGYKTLENIQLNLMAQNEYTNDLLTTWAKKSGINTGLSIEQRKKRILENMINQNSDNINENMEAENSNNIPDSNSQKPKH